MTFLKQLQSHRGGLIRLRKLYWYGGRGWDRSPGRICLVLDAAGPRRARAVTLAALAAAGFAADPDAAAVALLLIDGGPQWVWVAQADVELL
jgi:hypothetical protein